MAGQAVISGKLAIDGGKAVCDKLLWKNPVRRLITEEEKQAAVKVFDESIASGEAFGYEGKYEKQYVQSFVEFMGGGFADGVNSGTNALYSALGGLQLDALSEVIVPPLTDWGGVMPVPLLCCIPVFADSDPRSYNTSAEQIEPLINERTRAIVVAHIAGDPVDMDPVLELAKKHNLYVIEDCAQAHGARYKDKPVGTMGHFGIFSTMFGKQHCTGGQGGVVYTTNEKLHWQAKRFADRGKPHNINAPGNVVAGLNCNLNELSAAIGCVQIKRLPEFCRNRHRFGEMMKQRLEDNKALSLGWQVSDTYSTYWVLKIKLELDMLKVDKNTFCQALEAEGVLVNPSYRSLHFEAPWFQNKAVFGKSGFPWSCSDYKGHKNPTYRIDNAVKVTDTHFNIYMHEQFGEKEAELMYAAIFKVEKAYLK